MATLREHDGRRLLQPQRAAPRNTPAAADLDAPQLDTTAAAIATDAPLYAGKTLAQRMSAIVRTLEARALAGDTDAAKAALAHLRWAQEMRKGRPPLRGELTNTHRLEIVDDLGRSVRLPAGRRPLPLPATTIERTTRRDDEDYEED